jgi:hypothetical protein
MTSARREALDPRTPVIVGVGVASQHLDEPGSGLVATGIPQQTLLNDAHAAIRAGVLDVALIVGGEAARRAAIARRHGVTVVDTVQDGATPDDLQLPTDEIITGIEIDAGVSSQI